jgi:hypothetical protein
MLPEKEKVVQKNLTQTIISPDQKFILAKTINNFTDVICPFKKVNDKFITGFNLPVNQIHRIQSLYDIIPIFSKYTVIDKTVDFDCVEILPESIFGEATEGVIHFSSVSQKRRNGKNYFDVDSKLVFQNCADEPINNIEYEQNIKFKSDFLKIFPVILKQGFIFSTIDKSYCQLFISLSNPNDNFIGECSRYEIINTIQYIIPIWSIFNISIGKTIKIYLQNDFLKDLYYNELKPILLHISYNLENPSDISIKKIGNYTYIKPYTGQAEQSPS